MASGEGFFRSAGCVLGEIPDGYQNMYPEATLTAKGLDALNVKVQIGNEEMRAGDILMDQMKETGKDAGRYDLRNYREHRGRGR